MPGAPEQKSATRLLHLDVIRGLALLGILLMNIQLFATPILESVFFPEAPLQAMDRLLYFLLQVFVKGKFYILFSVLFGASFALIMQKSQNQQDQGRFLRRICVLFAFGLLHGLLIWSGDILLVYAVVGFFLWLLFRDSPVSRLPKWGVYFICQTIVPSWFFYLRQLWLGKQQAGYLAQLSWESLRQTAVQQKLVEEARFVISDGRYAEAIIQRWIDISLTLKMSFWGLPTILGFFLIGSWLYRSGRLIHPMKHRLFFQRLAFWGLLIGLPLNIASTYLMIDETYNLQTLRSTLAFTFQEIGGPLLALAYLSLIVIYLPKISILKIFSPAGRMALTNYLLQSMFWSFFMYGYGWGMAHQNFSLTTLISFALIFFAAQLVFSHFWLRYFDFGPFEWIWRRLSHKRGRN